ncbi:MAG: 50S ribosomal protein L23 [Candidatus Yanofskybacteria bacterium RIFCSPLOWO2_02_FULL_47_9b]|uniref:Large ribosomal subunit protein uL23 n=1 Tax=Candidatus Yanofskybacteria bacterium RIFCSPLOWO2_02_FULL_47_9b TaxID=1802708 RepID=A0A1F8H612_9BACT|nr:MAG: 50S ribosomal protein L23 [Candidatus Yanofskybacteria bacterium RIFCSPLOWO2_02_FULL_47_9b]
MTLIKRIYISEKATKAKNFNQYVFEVERNAVRPEIKKEIQKKYNVHVIKINVLNMPSKSITVGRHEGTKAGFRKAMVTLKAGETIAES